MQSTCHRNAIIFTLTNIIALVMVLGKSPKPLNQHINLVQVFSEMGVCVSYFSYVAL